MGIELYQMPFEGNNMIFILSFINMMNCINWCPIMELLLYSWNTFYKYIILNILLVFFASI